MQVVDANVLLYAVNRDAENHAKARRYLEQALRGDEAIGLSWPVLTAFLRVATNPRALSSPLAVSRALEVLDGWVGEPQVVLLSLGLDHWRILRSLLAESGTAGNLSSDAHLAAMAIEHGAVLVILRS